MKVIPQETGYQVVIYYALASTAAKLYDLAGLLQQVQDRVSGIANAIHDHAGFAQPNLVRQPAGSTYHGRFFFPLALQEGLAKSSWNLKLHHQGAGRLK